MDLLLFYREHFYGFSESDLWKRQEKNTSEQTYMYMWVTDIQKFY